MGGRGSGGGKSSKGITTSKGERIYQEKVLKN